MKLGIRSRLFVPLALLLLGVVGISLWSAASAARQAEGRIARQVRGVTHTLAGTSIALTPRILEQMKGLSGADYLLIDADDQRISTLPDANVEIPPAVAQQPADSDAEVLGPPITIDGRVYRCRRLPQRAGGNLYILYPEVSLDEAIRDAVRPALVFGLAGGLTAVALMAFIGQRFVRRIRELDRRTRRIAAGDFSPMPLPSTHDELRDLARSVNEMAERLSQLQETVRNTERVRLLGQLSSGLAHQLRNSATGARLAIELCLGDQPPPGPEELHVALRQLKLMEANLRRFMDLGRSESDKPRPFDVTELIDDVVGLLKPQATHGNISIIWKRPPDGSLVLGNANQIRDALQNVISNAIEAAGPAGTVEITAQAWNGFRGPTAVIEVADTGPGPPPHIAARLFDPFVTGKPEGIGLGLSVARHAVEQHGGQLTWERVKDRTVFRIVLCFRPT